MMIVKFTPDDGRRVYSVPVKLIVECTLFVLATSDAHARKAIGLADLAEYFGFDSDSVTTDGDHILKIDDIITLPIDTTVVDITELSVGDYPPNTHPDFVGIPEK